MDNYPPGSARDPKAPWNQDDSDLQFEETHRGRCDICDDKRVPLNDDNECEDCFLNTTVIDEDDDLAGADLAYESSRDK